MKAEILPLGGKEGKGRKTAVRWTKYPEFALWVIGGISETSKEVVRKLIQDFEGWSVYEILGTYPRGVVIEAVRRYLKEKDL